MTDNRKIARLRSENESLDREKREVEDRLRRGGMLPVLAGVGVLVGLTLAFGSLPWLGWLVMIGALVLLLWYWMQRSGMRTRLGEIEQEIQHNEEQIRAEIGLD